MVSIPKIDLVVRETAPARSVIHQIEANIPEGAERVRYRILSGTPEQQKEYNIFRKYFRIDPISGELSVHPRKALDAEMRDLTSFTVEIRYREADGTMVRMMQKINIHLEDIVENNEAISIDSSIAANALIGKVDFGGAGASYTIIDDTTDAVSTQFFVDSEGNLRVKEGADFGTTTQTYQLQIQTNTPGVEAINVFVTVGDIGTTVQVTGNFVAEEDISLYDPAGQITVTSAAQNDVTDYQLHINGVRVVGDGVRVETAYGYLIANADGAWQYVLDNDNADVEGLHGRAGEDGHQLTETVSYQLKLGDKVLSGTFDITINGRTDVTYTNIFYGNSNFEATFGVKSDEHVTFHYDGPSYGNSRIVAPAINAETGRSIHPKTGGDDVWIAPVGADHGFDGGGGNDIIIGGDGSQFLGGHDGINVLDGGEGGEDEYTYDSIFFHFLNADAPFIINYRDPVKWKYDPQAGEWISGTDATFTYRIAWSDTNGNGVVDKDDWVDFFKNFEHWDGDGSDHDDIIIGNDFENTFTGGKGHDLFIGGAGRDDFEGADGINIADGGASGPDALFAYYRLDASPDTAVIFNPDVKWKRSDEETNTWSPGTWSSGVGDDYTYSLIWADVNGNGIVDEGDQADFFKNFEEIRIITSNGDDVVTGLGTIYSADENFYRVEGFLSVSIIETHGGDDTLIGSGYGDRLDGGADDDVLTGNGGYDVLIGGTGNDVFVLDVTRTTHADDLALAVIVTDFGVGNDRIRIDTATGAETSLDALKEAAGIRWAEESYTVTGRRFSSNDRATADTVIYLTKGTEDLSDDVAFMVLEDFAVADLTIGHFDIV